MNIENIVHHAVDGRNPANQLRLIVYPNIYKVFDLYPRWLFRIASNNSTDTCFFFVSPGESMAIVMLWGSLVDPQVGDESSTI